MKTIETAPFRVREGETVRLSERPTLIEPVYGSKSRYRDLLQHHVKAMSRLQQRHYAAARQALLLIFQSMDAGGKDSAIRHVMSGVNPQGCQVFSFKHPSATELDHDFLWRTTACLPERGRIGIFNRSYYEEVLIVRVHPELLVAERVTDCGARGSAHDGIWRDRFESIRAHERHLTRNGTKVVKVFLHLSKEEQRKRFLERIDDPDKTWKIDPADLKERAFWLDYQRAYEDCLSATSTEDAPWYVIPADDKKTARLLISQLVLDSLEALHPAFPEPDAERRRQLARMREELSEG